MIRDVMFAVTHTSRDDPALRAAVELVRVHSAHLSVVLPLDLPLATSTTGLSTLVLDDSFAALRNEMEGLAENLRGRLRGEGISHEVRVAEGVVFSAGMQLSLQARYADLVVMATPPAGGGDAGVMRAMFASLLLQSGRPVLVVPPDWSPVFPASSVTIGWTPTRESARVVHDALPMLVTAGKVHLAVIEPLVGERQHGEDPGADIARHLARHGLDVEVDVRPTKRGSIASELLLQVVEKKCDLLVVGGYGHSRAREWALGGTTRELLAQSHVPVLYSH